MNEIAELLERGVSDLVVRKDLEEKIKSGKKLRVKFGIDPTGSDLHIGHAVILRKLRDFQNMGHHIILILGTFTAQIGDPTGKTEVRKVLSREEVQSNIQNYKQEISKILDVNKVEFRENHEWLADMSFTELIEVSQSFTVSQMIERDMFQDRMKKGLPISLHEFFYPLMQAYDSVVLRADLEIGATEQTFNLLAGRTLQKAFGEKPQDVMTMPVLEGTDGKEKMSKSLGNFIAISDSPREMFGKTMSIPDELIIKYFELTTDYSQKDIEQVKKSLAAGENPRNAKLDLARNLVNIYHGAEAASVAQREFLEMFQKKGLPEDMPQFNFEGSKGILDILFESKVLSSKSEARRMISQNAVSIDGEKITDPNLALSCNQQVIKVGKRKFLKLGKA